MRRFVTLALSFSLVLGLSAAGSLLAQDEVKKVEDKPAATSTDVQKADAPAADAPKADAAAPDTKDEAKPAETPAADAAPPSIPPEVEAKLEAARKAVAEAIVAAQDAGLVETSIDPPPILDILITGRATDLKTVKGITKESPEAGVSPEVFGAWYTGYGKAIEGVTQNNIRIIQPAKGLKEWYAARAAFLNKYIDEARQAKTAPAEEKKEEAKPADEKKPDEPKDEAKPADEEKKPEEPKTEEAPKTEETKPAEEPKAEEAPKAEETAPPAEEPKAEEAPKTEEAPQV